MVSVSASSTRTTDIKYYASAEYTATMSTNDTITANEFVSTENLKKAVIMRHSSGTELTNTVLNNVVTLTEAGITSQEVTVWVFGVRS
jgi:hypothetical protein